MRRRYKEIHPTAKIRVGDAPCGVPIFKAPLGEQQKNGRHSATRLVSFYLAFYHLKRIMSHYLLSVNHRTVPLIEEARDSFRQPAAATFLKEEGFTLAPSLRELSQSD